MLKKGLYRHYKGGMYEVLDLVMHSENLEQMVLYRSLNGSDAFPKDTLWVRPLAMFLETVHTDQGEVPRFTPLGSATEIEKN